MLSASQISGFLSQSYLRSNRFNQLDFLYAGIYWIKITTDLKIFIWVWSQKGLGQSDCRILESDIFQVRMDKSV